MTSDDGIQELCDQVRQTPDGLHRYLRYGHPEKVYENGLVHCLRKAGLVVEQQKPLQVTDEDGRILGDYFADLFLDERLTVELKAVKALKNAHIAQVLRYLPAANKRHALLINFGRLE